MLESLKRSWPHSLVALTILLIGWLLFQCIEPQVLGFIHDDGIYAITAKALATGKGYTLLNLWGQPPQIKYPGVYPLILSLGWLLNPAFPKNLLLMSGLTLLFSLAGLMGAFYFLRNTHGLPTWLAWLCLWLIAGNFYFIFHSTALMSEGPYLFFSLATLLYAHKILKNPTPSKTQWGLLILLSVLTFHTRLIGLTLILAIGLYLLLTKRWRQALGYTLPTLGLTSLSWWAWGALYQSHYPMGPLTAPIYRAYGNYATELQGLLDSGAYWSHLQGAFGSMMERIQEALFPGIHNFFEAFNIAYLSLPKHGFDLYLVVKVAGLLFLSGYLLLQGIEAIRKKTWSVSGLYLTLYLLLTACWSYEDQMARFLVVVLPLLWLYFFKPWAHRLQRPWTPPALSILLVLAVLNLYPGWKGWQGLHHIRHQHWLENGGLPELWSEYQATFAFIKNKLPPQARVASAEDVALYLYTDHPTYYLFFPSLPRKGDKYPKSAVEALIPSMRHAQVRYVVLEPEMKNHELIAPANRLAEYLVTRHPEQFRAVYLSPKGMIMVYEFLPTQRP